MNTVSITEARASLPDIIDRVNAGEEVTITRHGHPVAVVLRPDAVRARRADDAYRRAQQLREALDKARHEPIPSKGLTIEHGEELIKEIRADRDAR